MKKFTLVVPACIRYISDWAKMEGGYRLENFPFPHIVDKQITGCGFTEYCLTNTTLNEIICSPRRVLLENKSAQHIMDPSVIYFKNDAESSGMFDQDIEKVNNVNNAVSQGAYSEMLREMLSKEAEEQKQAEDFSRIGKLKDQLCSEILHNIEAGRNNKILVTYDSFRHVKDVLEKLGIFEQFFVVVDEFQSIFTDAKFKSGTEIELLSDLRKVQKLCYVSATPMIDKYLEMLDEFKDLPFFEFDWAKENPNRIIKPEINAKGCSNIVHAINLVIGEYKSGKFEVFSYLDNTGKIQEIESREAVIYVNSVKHLCSIIKSSKLTLEDTNVLCARSVENEKKIRAAFKSTMGNLVDHYPQVIGTVPMKGEQHKMFTLCTRTVYLGADFYSTNARTFIASDANIDCLAVDISLDLPQILGRQRLLENPWKNRATLFYKTLSAGKKISAEEFKERMLSKIEETDRLLKIYSSLNTNEDKASLAKTYQRVASVDHYKDNYVAVNRHSGSSLIPVCNSLVLVADQRTYEIQQMDFKDRVMVLNTMSENYLVIEDNTEEHLAKIKDLPTFPEKLKYLCELDVNDVIKQRIIQQLPVVFGNYYNTLGPDRLRELGYKNDLIKQEYLGRRNNQRIDITTKILEEFEVGKRYLKSQIKEKLRKIYQEVGLLRTPKAVDLIDYFEVRLCDIAIDGGKYGKGFEILNIK